MQKLQSGTEHKFFHFSGIGLQDGSNCSLRKVLSSQQCPYLLLPAFDDGFHLFGGIHDGHFVDYDTKYCDRVAEGETRSCQELAAQERYKQKAADNAALLIYSKHYKRYAARVKVRQIKKADFKKWKFQALVKQDECTNGIITVEEFVEWLEGCFPNRGRK